MASIRDDDVAETIGLDIAAELKLRGIAKDDAEKIAVGVTQKLRFLYSGHTIYFMKDHLRKLDRRDAEIFDAFDGRNYSELAFQYGLSEMRIRQIIEKIMFCRRGKSGRNLLVREVCKNNVATQPSDKAPLRLVKTREFDEP